VFSIDSKTNTKFKPTDIENVIGDRRALQREYLIVVGGCLSFGWMILAQFMKQN